MNKEVIKKIIYDKLDIYQLLDYFLIDIEEETYKEVLAFCPHPQHDDNKGGRPSFTINKNREDTKHYLMFRCWSCPSSHRMYGDVIRLVSILKKIKYNEALQWLFEFVNDEQINDDNYIEKNFLENSKKSKLKNNINKRKKEKEINYNNFYEIELPNNCELVSKISKKEKVWDYLFNRGLSEKVIDEFALCYCYAGYYSDRVIIPIVINDKIFSFVARDILGKEQWLKSNQQIFDKKINGYRPSNEKDYHKILYPKGPLISMLLYPILTDEEINNLSSKRLYVVEGIFDMLRLQSLNIINSVCNFGWSIGNFQGKIDYYNKFDELISIDDKDDSNGYLLSTSIKETFTNKINKRVNLPLGTDCGNCPEEKLIKEINNPILSYKKDYNINLNLYK